MSCGQPLIAFLCIKTDEICTQSAIGQRITSDHCTSVIEYLTLGNINKSVREGQPLGLGPGYKTCMCPCICAKKCT